jgi:hypothetical protein
VLLENFGGLNVKLSSSNSYSYSKLVVPFRDYVTDHVAKKVDRTSMANETFYLFGDIEGERWTQLYAHYVMPSLLRQDERRTLAFGVGADGSGVQLHVHGAVWAEALFGLKRWVLFPPDFKPTFDADRSALQVSA